MEEHGNERIFPQDERGFFAGTLAAIAVVAKWNCTLVEGERISFFVLLAFFDRKSGLIGMETWEYDRVQWGREDLGNVGGCC